MKVLIVGAGPVGLSAALALAENGIIPEVVEKRTEASQLSRAVGIMPATRTHLSSSGVADTIMKEGMPFMKLAAYRGTKSLLDVDFNTIADLGAGMTGLPQDRTETIIREAAEKLGVQVKFGVELKDISTSDIKASAVFANDDRADYDWIIAADGKDSTARTKLGIPYPGIDLPETWSIADVDLEDGYDTQTVSVWVQGDNGLFVIVLPIERKRLRIVSSTPDCLASIPFKLSISNTRRTGTFKISIRQAESYKKGRVLLAGDAAHCHSPVGGRGMNLGIDDAFAVAQAIITGTTDDYTQSRHGIGGAVLKDSEAARKFLTSNKLLHKVLANFVCGLAQHSKAVQKKLFQKTTTL